MCVRVFFPFILDIKFVGRTSRGHTGGRSRRISHPPSFCGACLNFSREKECARNYCSIINRGQNKKKSSFLMAWLWGYWFCLLLLPSLSAVGPNQRTSKCYTVLLLFINDIAGGTQNRCFDALTFVSLEGVFVGEIPINY